jgi:predicted dehydrogenase
VTIHDLDTARWMIGEIDEVTAVGAALSDPAFAELGDPDHAVVVLRFADGALGVIDNSRAAGYGYECSAEVMGSKATVRIGRHRRVHNRWLTPGTASVDWVVDFTELSGRPTGSSWRTLQRRSGTTGAPPLSARTHWLRSSWPRPADSRFALDGRSGFSARTDRGESATS